jgi:predicted aspartyl protease
LLVRALAAASQPAAVPFGLTSRGGIIVPIVVDGSGPVSALLDTGSNGSIVSERLAASRGMRPVGRTTILSVSGQKEAQVTRIGHLAIGTACASDVLATVARDEDLDLPDAGGVSRIQGIIGQDVLGRLRYTIDYTTRSIYWRGRDAAAPPHGSRFELERHDERFVVRLPQPTGELRLVPDTGADALILFETPLTIAEHAATGAAIGITGVTGTRAAHRAVVRKLAVGDTTLRDVPAAIVPRAPGAPDVDGLRPLHLFARVSFDGPDRQLFSEPR